MSLIQRQDALVKDLEVIYQFHFQMGYKSFSGATIGRRSRAMRLHAEAMMKDGYSRQEAWDSAHQCNDVAFLNAGHQALVAQMGGQP